MQMMLQSFYFLQFHSRVLGPLAIGPYPKLCLKVDRERRTDEVNDTLILEHSHFLFLLCTTVNVHLERYAKKERASVPKLRR